MKVQTSRRSFLTLESVAMTDIVMNLFIFFFISFSLLYTFNPEKESKIGVKLPEGRAQGGPRQKEQDLVVSITADNEIYISKKRIYPNQLRERLSEEAKRSRSQGVVVRADKMTSVDYLVKVLDAAKALGMSRLGVAVEEM